MGLFGPIGLLVALVLGRGGFRLVPRSKEERWELFREKFELLGRDYFERVHG